MIFRRRSGRLGRASLLAALAPLIFAGAHAQNPPAQRNPGDVDARIDLEESRRRGFAIEAPAMLPLKNTSYPVPPGAFFVAPDGKESNAGTDKAAPTTVQKALETAPQGGTIVFRGGTYRGGGWIVGKKLTLQAFPGEKPWLKGSVVASGWTKDGAAGPAAWRHDGWKAHFPPRGYNATVLDKIIEKKYPLAAHSDMVFVDGRALVQVGTRPEVRPGSFYVDYKNNALYLGDDPTQGVPDKTVEVSAHEFGIQITKRGAYDGSGSVLRGLGLAHYASQGAGTSAPNVVIENCTSVWNAGSGFDLHPWNGGVKGAIPADCVVRGNTFSANGSNGMSAGEAPRLLVEKNVLSYNNVEGFRRSWGAAGIKVVKFGGFVCRDNVVEHNYASGIWMDVDMNGSLVYRNLVRHNNGLGIFFEISDQATIAFNVVHDNSTGIQVSNSTRARIVNNTLVNNNKSFYAQWWQRVNHEGKLIAGIARGKEYVTRDNVFKNNLVVYTKLKKGPVLEAQGGPEKSSARVTESDHNVYYFADVAKDTPAVRWAKNGGEMQSFATLAEFVRAEPGYERNSLFVAGQANDPFFVNAPAGNFRLRPGNPALNKAEPLPPDIAQVVGVPANIGHVGALGTATGQSTYWPDSARLSASGATERVQ